MPILRSTQRELDKAQETIRRVRVRDSLGRDTAIRTDKIIEFNSPDAQQVFEWLSSLPADVKQLLGPEVPPKETAEVYKDYLNWAATSVECLEKELDMHEMEYRRLGLKYHETPLYLRDPTATLYNPRPRGLSPNDLRMSSAAPALPPINPTILHSLKSAFDLDCPRTHHYFFTNWCSVQHAFTGIRNLLNVDYTHFRLRQLRLLLDSVEHDIESAADLLNHIGTQLDGVSRNLREVVARRMMGEGAGLCDAFSVAGSAYRRWVSTFPEVAGGEVEVEVAERVLRVCGPELSMDWEGDYVSWMNEEEGVEGLGMLWEMDREYD